MDETVINGANLFFAPQFGIDVNSGDAATASRNQWLLGLVNSAPYLCCAVLGCWLTDPVRTTPSSYYRPISNCSTLLQQLNRFFGRRGTIFITALVSFLACIWQGLLSLSHSRSFFDDSAGVTNSWPHLFVARFVLGLGEHWNTFRSRSLSEVLTIMCRHWSQIKVLFAS